MAQQARKSTSKVYIMKLPFMPEFNWPRSSRDISDNSETILLYWTTVITVLFIYSASIIIMIFFPDIVGLSLFIGLIVLGLAIGLLVGWWRSESYKTQQSIILKGKQHE
jgi:hypothetical protein